MVSVEVVIRDFSERASSREIGIFVASCAERMAQLFTGLIGSDVARPQDVELVIRCLDVLWLPNPLRSSLEEMVGQIGSFPELMGDEEPLGLMAYAYDAVATLYYAARYQTGGDLTDVISCSNHALNSASYVSDELDDGVDRYEIESRNQKADMAILLRLHGSDGRDSVQVIRDRARELSRERLFELTGV